MIDRNDPGALDDLRHRAQHVLLARIPCTTRRVPDRRDGHFVSANVFDFVRQVKRPVIGLDPDWESLNSITGGTADRQLEVERRFPSELHSRVARKVRIQAKSFRVHLRECSGRSAVHVVVDGDVDFIVFVVRIFELIKAVLMPTRLRCEVENARALRTFERLSLRLASVEDVPVVQLVRSLT